MMNGILWVVIGVSIGLLAPVLIVLWRRRLREEPDSLPTAVAPRRAATPAPARQQAPAGTPIAGGLKRQLARRFHGVSVKVGPHPCHPIQEISGRRFLPEEAPPLPLVGCDQQKCQCAYSHHGDRRDQENRRSGGGTFGGFTPTVPGGNRRAKARERRALAAKGQPASS